MDVETKNNHQTMTELLSQLSEVKKNDSEIRIQNLGEEYTDAIYSPVTAILAAMTEVYGTSTLPISHIDTDVTKVDMSEKSFLIYIRIGTSQQGYLRGLNDSLTHILIKKLADVFHVREQNIALAFFTIDDIHVVDV